MTNLQAAISAGDIVGAVTGLCVFGLIIAVTVKKAEDPARMVFKWVLTAGIVGYMAWGVAPALLAAPQVALPYGVLCSLGLAVIWCRNLIGLVASPLAGLFDGGNIPPDPKPAYSIAQSRQKQGRYLEAVEEIQKQLEKFPTDFEGHLLLAQIQAENLNDMESADLTIQRLCSQPNHAPKNITFALYSLADWYLAVAQDIEGAHRALEQLIALLPETEYALRAAQRIGHLSNLEQKTFTVSEGIQNMGLMKDPAPVQPHEEGPAEQAARYVKHLDEHPLDTDARERLAVLYADHYGRLDLATAELEQLIVQPNQPAKLVVRWLNLLADLQVRGGTDYDSVRDTLQRIIERDPKGWSAEIAAKRLALLGLELKGQQRKAGIKMGTYEQNIGLRSVRGVK